MFRLRTSSPSYQAVIGDDNTDDDESDNGTLDVCALLFQFLSTLRLTSPYSAFEFASNNSAIHLSNLCYIPAHMLSLPAESVSFFEVQ
jgi:hypothetical protein